jgi:hypothetical protein
MDLNTFCKTYCINAVQSNKQWLELAESCLSDEEIELFKSTLSSTGMTIFKHEPLIYQPTTRDLNSWD